MSVIYHIIVGDFNELNNITNLFNTKNKDKTVEYITLKTMVPIDVHKDILEQKINKCIDLDPNVHEIQAYAFSSYSVQHSHIIVCIKDNLLTFPNFTTSATSVGEMEKYLLSEFKSVAENKFENLIKNNIRQIAMVGKNAECLVFLTKIKKK